jgi:hypothetical protein
MTVDKFPAVKTTAICDRLSVTRLAAHPKCMWFSTPPTMLETFIITPAIAQSIHFIQQLLCCHPQDAKFIGIYFVQICENNNRLNFQQNAFIDHEQTNGVLAH